MPSRGQVGLAASLMKEQLIAAAPRIDEVQIEVRTNGMMRPDVLMAQGAPELFGEFVVEWCFDVADAELPRFQEALLAAEKVLVTAAAGSGQATCPDGVRYLGTYYVVSGGAPGCGRYRTLWAYRDYAAFQAWRDRERIVESEFAQALRLLTLYHNRESPAGFTTTITTRAVGLRPHWATPAAGGGAGAAGRRGRAPRKAP